MSTRGSVVFSAFSGGVALTTSCIQLDVTGRSTPLKHTYCTSEQQLPTATRYDHAAITWHRRADIFKLLTCVHTNIFVFFRIVMLFKLGVPDVAGLANTMKPACLSSFQTVPENSCIVLVYHSLSIFHRSFRVIGLRAVLDQDCLRNQQLLAETDQ